MGQLKSVIIALIGLLVLITLFVSTQKPTLHKQALFSDEYHKFVEEELPLEDFSLSNVAEAPKQTIKVVQTQVPKKQIINKVEPKRQVQKPVVQKQVPVVEQKVEQPKHQQVQPQQVKKQEVVVVEEPDEPTTPRKLTEQEEIIAWNKWRSNLQNQIMKDAPIRAPLGTGFKFSFTVDKYGNLSNIKVWSTNSAYTDLAVRVIKPVLNSYSHKPILNFPEGTNRVITNVNGGYVISTRTEYSKPSDYSDYETVKRYY